MVCNSELTISLFKKPNGKHSQNYSGDGAGPERNFHPRGHNINFKEESAKLGASQKKKENTNNQRSWAVHITPPKNQPER
jgi:hypothetical protein